MSASTDPGNKSAAEIEREVEGTRARLTGTIEELKEKVSPNNLMDQAVEYLRGSGGQEFVQNLGSSVRNNPLPVLLIGAGIGWLMLSGNRRNDYETAGRMPPAPRRTTIASSSMQDYEGTAYPQAAYGSSEYSSSSYGGSTASDYQGGPSLRDKAGSTLSSVREGVSGAASSVREGVSSAAAQAGEALSSARESLAGAAQRAGQAVSGAVGSVTGGARGATHNLTGRAGYMADRGYYRAQGMGEGMVGVMRDQPLVAGGLGLLIGAALGAMLPGSEAEDRLMGETRDDLAAKAQTLAEQGYQQAKEVANEHLSNIRSAADETYGRVREHVAGSGVSPERGADALGQVAREVREAVEQTARDISGQARDAANGGGSKPAA
jgi:ElaB/YqjD/DUF883 family membrane-anchored ribosome-binding protein